jgi:hypothetical protein
VNFRPELHLLAFEVPPVMRLRTESHATRLNVVTRKGVEAIGVEAVSVEAVNHVAAQDEEQVDQQRQPARNSGDLGITQGDWLFHGVPQVSLRASLVRFFL